MKLTAKRILALLCVTMMLFSCCLSGLTFMVSADATAGGTTQYSNKWTIFYPGESGETLTYAAGGRFVKAVSGFHAVIPSTYAWEDMAVYVHMTLDETAVTAFEKGGAVELSQSTVDKSERWWNLASPEWQVGENAILLPLSASGSNLGGAAAFDLYSPINFFRMYADPNAAEFTANSSVTIWEIALVDISEAGVRFGDDDTYLQLSAPLSATPNTIEVSVKAEKETVGKEPTSWYISENGAGVASGSAASGVSDGSGTGYNTLPQGLSYTIGSSQGGGSKSFSALPIPEKYTTADLALSFWLWVDDANAFNSGYIELTSSGTWDQNEWNWNIGHLKNTGKVTLTNGWNYVCLPFSWGSESIATFDLYGINFIRFHSKSCIIGMSDVKVEVLAETKLLKEKEWLLYSMYDVIADDTKVTDGAGGEPAGLPYVEGTLAGNGQFLLWQGFNALDIPSGTQQKDLSLSFWMYLDDRAKISSLGHLELSSSGTCDKQEIEIQFLEGKSCMANVTSGWNYVVIPLASDWIANNNGGAFNPTAINFIRWYGVATVDGAPVVARLANLKISSIADDTASWDVTNLLYSWGMQAHTITNAGAITWGNLWDDWCEGAAPNVGSHYVEFTAADAAADFNAALHFHNNAGSLILSEMFVIPEKYRRDNIALSFWMYVNDTDLLRDKVPEIYLGSAYSRNDIQYDGNLLASLQDGWNYIELPLSSFKDLTGSFNMQFINYFRIDQVYAAPAGVVRYADIELKVISEPTITATAVNVTEKDDVFFGNTNTADANPIALFANSDGNVCWVWGDKQYASDFNIRTGEWIDLALVRDTAAGKFTLYADGVVVAEADAAGTADILPTVAHSIGADGLGVTLDGTIADVRAWSDARTADEINAGRVSKIGRTTCGFTADEQGLIDAWFLVGDLNYVLSDTVVASIKGNDLVFRGSRADDWVDYEIPTDVIGEDYYTMVFVPDTQELVTGKFTEEWMAAAQWIADNVETENIVHVIGAGDNTWTNATGEWNNAKAGWDLFTDKVSWSNMTGNHDYPGSCTPVDDPNHIIRDTTNYNNLFGIDYIQSTAAANTYIGSFADDYDIYGTEADANGKYSGAENSYYRFNVNGVQWMILQIEYHPRVSVINWANDILDKYPNDNVIFTTHAYITGDNADYCPHWMPYTKSDAEIGGYIGDLMPSGAVAWPGGTEQPIWTEIVAKHNNVKLLLCGHAENSDGHVLTRWDTNEAGNVVPQVMINAQMEDIRYFNDYAMSMLGILRFSADGTKVEIQYYSPFHDASYHPSNQAMRSLELTTTTACTHENTTTTTVDATCTEDGSITVTCACGEVVSTETIPMLGHKEPTGTWNALQYCLNDCGTVIYDLQALLNAGGEVTLDRDLVTDKALVINTTVVLNLAGYSISTTELDTDGSGVFYVPAGGDLTINGEGTINGVGNNDYSMAIWANGGKVTINGGTYTNVGAGEDDHYDLIYVKNGGEVVINGGTFIAHTPVWTLNSNDNLKGTFVVNGGKFYQYDPANNITENPTQVWVADGFETVQEGDYFVLVEHVPTVEIIDGRYYEDGVKVPYAGLVLYEGNYYYVGDNAKVVKGRFFASRFNEFTQFTNGYYYFDEETGVMNTEEAVFDGYYYADGGKAGAYAGLVELDGDYYYVLNKGEAVVGRYSIVKTNDLKAKGLYCFDAEGKMITNTVVDGYYYSESGLAESYLGLVKAADGNLYYVQSQGKVVKDNDSFFVTKTNGYVEQGRYAFDENGAMIR